MMNTSQAYNCWSATYDEVENKTRDLEAKTVRTMLSDISFHRILELGCGTGKNTEWYAQKAHQVTAVDFSEDMMSVAKNKVGANVQFHQADITKPWNFVSAQPDLICCSLILEHIQDLDFVFSEAARISKPGTHFYIGELHPYKQYSGSKARFETSEGTFVLECYTHPISEFINAAAANGFVCTRLEEPGDQTDELTIPRIAAFLFKKL